MCITYYIYIYIYIHTCSLPTLQAQKWPSSSARMRWEPSMQRNQRATVFLIDHNFHHQGLSASNDLPAA